MIGLKQNKPVSVLSLDWRYDTLRFESVRKSTNACQSHEKGEFNLPEDLFSVEPELVGTQLREKLNSLDLQGKACVSTLPVGWLFTFRTEVPDLNGEDLEFFYATQAEREFPFPIEDLHIARSAFHSPEGKSYVFMAAIPVQRLAYLNKVLESARLKPLSWSLHWAGGGFLDSLPDANALCLSPTSSGFDLVALSGQKLAMARSLNETSNAQQIAREIKISVGELPPDLQSSLKYCYYFQEEGAGGEFDQALQDVADRLGLKPSTLSQHHSPAFDLASDYLLDRGNPFEFLPPKVTAFQEWSQKISTGRNKWFGGGAAAAILIISLLFFWQSQKLQALDEEWKAMEIQVGELEELQNRIRLYRPWFDESIPTLKLIQHLAEAFPEQGDVWVKELDIREPYIVVCSGFARNNRAWLAMLEKLRNSSEVKDLAVLQVREDKQLQFSFQYRWEESKGNE